MPLNNQLILGVHEVCSRKNVLQLTPWVLVEKNVETFDNDDLVLLAVEMNLVLLWILLSVVKIWETANTFTLCP